MAIERPTPSADYSDISGRVRAYVDGEIVGDTRIWFGPVSLEFDVGRFEIHKVTLENFMYGICFALNKSRMNGGPIPGTTVWDLKVDGKLVEPSFRAKGEEGNPEGRRLGKHHPLANQSGTEATTN